MPLYFLTFLFFILVYFLKLQRHVKTDFLNYCSKKKRKKRNESVLIKKFKKVEIGNNFFWFVADFAQTGCLSRRRCMKLFVVVLFPSGGPVGPLWVEGAVDTPRRSVTAMLLLFLSLLWPSLSTVSSDNLPPSWLNYIHEHSVMCWLSKVVN